MTRTELADYLEEWVFAARPNGPLELSFEKICVLNETVAALREQPGVRVPEGCVTGADQLSSPPDHDWATETAKDWQHDNPVPIANIAKAYLVLRAIDSGPTSEEVADFVRRAFELSKYAAAVHWNPQSRNTQEWLDGLRELIEAVQDHKAILRWHAQGEKR